MIAKSVVAPLDRVKINFQTMNPQLSSFSGSMSGTFRALQAIYRKFGIRGLYKGHSAMLMRIFPYAAINYTSYEHFRRLLYKGRPTSSVEWWRRILAGSSAGSVAVLCTYPLDIIRARLAFQLKGDRVSTFHLNSYFKSMRDVISSLIGEGRAQHRWGISGLYQGFGPTVMGIIPYAGVSYFSFEFLKNWYLLRHGHKEGPATPATVPTGIKLLMGMLAGSLAQTASYPLDVIRRRIQVLNVADYMKQSFVAANRQAKPSVWTIFRMILKERGLRGLYVGLSINYIKVAPATGVSFVVYEFMREKLARPEDNGE